MWQTLAQRRQFQQNPPQFEPAVAYFQFIKFKGFLGSVELSLEDEITEEQHHGPSELNEFKKHNQPNRLS